MRPYIGLKAELPSPLLACYLPSSSLSHKLSKRKKQQTLDPISLLSYRSKSMVGPPFEPATATIKFLCSYGGKIVPRYPDGKLRYVGGHTRVLAVDRSISFPGFIGGCFHGFLIRTSEY